MKPTVTADRHDSFARMMRLGQACYVQGARKQAHRYWRRAALINPTQEQVWVSLLQVVETPDDRRVCLENILAINPQNKEAQRDLSLLEATPLQRAQITAWMVVRPVVAAVLLGVLVAVGVVAFQFLSALS